MIRTSARRTLPGRLALLLFTTAFTLLNGGLRTALGDVDCRQHHAELPAHDGAQHGSGHHTEAPPAPQPCECLSACQSSTALHAVAARVAPPTHTVAVSEPHAAIPPPPLVRHPHALPFANAPPPLHP